MPTVHLIISGRVQGISYRAATRDFATRLALTGWVRNTPDGNVELTATGPEPALKQLIAWCHHGPPLAVVNDVSVQRVPETPFNGFEIRRG
ncbi:MAG TPA: acylphosphatase [Puia sp.]|nr:acylphosphatase [Puia sp.]